MTVISVIYVLFPGKIMRSDWATPLNPFILLYLIFTLTAFVVSPLPERSLPYLIQAGGGVSGFLIVYAWLDRPARLRWLLQAMVLAAGALSLAGFFLVEWPSQYLFDLRLALTHLPHLPLPFSIHPNAIAGALLPPLCLAWGVWRFRLSRWQRAWLIVAVALMSLMLLLTQSRNAWLALLAAWVAYQVWGRFRFVYFAIGLGVLIALPFAVNLLPAAGLSHLERGVAFVDNASKSGESDEPSWLSRLEIWRVAGQTLADYPAVGVGLYAFEPMSRANYVYAVVSPQLNFTHAHNLFWQTTVNLGIMGLLTAVCLWGATLWGLWQRQPQLALDGVGWTAVDWTAVDWTAVVGAAFISSLWFNLFDLIAWEMKAGVTIWLLLAVAMRLSPAQKTYKASGLAGVVLAAWLILLLSPSGQGNWQRLQLDQARFTQTTAPPMSPTTFANDARRLGLAYFLRQEVDTAVSAWQADAQSVTFLRQQGVMAFYEGEWETAVTWHNLALQLDKTDGLTHYWLGMAYEAQGNPTLARRHYDLALANLRESGPTDVVAETWEGRGRVMAQSGQWKAAADSFAQAVALFPDNPDYAQQLREVNLLLQEEE